MYKFVRVSGDKKTGPIAVVYCSGDTCPPGCPYHKNGCYFWGFIRLVKIASRATDNIQAIFYSLMMLSIGAIFRWGVTGDLPGIGNRINEGHLTKIAVAARRRRLKPIIYTHKDSPSAIEIIERFNRGGFTINRSANHPAHADELLRGSTPVVVTLSDKAVPANWKRAWTPGGTPIIRCPAEYTAIQCANCGAGTPLCSRQRNYVVGFTSGGSQKARARAVASRSLPILELPA